MDAPEISKKISLFYDALKFSASPSEIASQINSILLYVEHIPKNILDSAWDMFAKQKGVIK